MADESKQHIAELDFDITKAIKDLETLAEKASEYGKKIGNNYKESYEKSIADMSKNDFNLQKDTNNTQKNTQKANIELKNIDKIISQIQEIEKITESQARRIATTILNQQEMTAAAAEREIRRTSESTIRANTEIYKNKEKSSIQTAFNEEKRQKEIEAKVKASNIRIAEDKIKSLSKIENNNKILADKNTAYEQKKVIETNNYKIKKITDTENAVRKIKENTLGRLAVEEKKHIDKLEQLRLQSEVKSNKHQGIGSFLSTAGLWFGAYEAIHLVKRAITDTFKTIKDVELAIVDVTRVIQDETYNAEKFTSSIFQMSKDYARSFEDTIEVSKRFAQAGYNVNETLAATKSAMLALNTAELDVQNSTQSMIGIMQQWGMEASDMQLMIDKINKTADQNAITSQDLVDGLLKAGAAAKTAKMSFDETVGMLVAMKEASGQAGKEVGNAMKAIIAYIQRPKSMKTFESLGIDTWADEAKTTLRPVIDVLEDLSKAWNTNGDAIYQSMLQDKDMMSLVNAQLSENLDYQSALNDANNEALSDAERQSAVETAGMHRRTYFISLLENFSKIQEVTNGLIDAEGYSMRENAIYMETLEAKYQQFLVSLKELAVQAGNSGLMDLAKGTLDVALALTSLIKNIGGVIPVLQAIIGLIIVLKRQSIASGIVNFGKKLELGIAALKIFAFNLKDANAKQAMFQKTTLTTSVVIGGLTAALGIATMVFTAITMAVSAYNEAQRKNIENALEAGQAATLQSQEIIKLKNEYDILSENANRTQEQEEKLLEVTNKLSNAIGLRKTELEGLTAGTKEYTDALEKQIAIESVKIQSDLENAQIAAKDAALLATKTEGIFNVMIPVVGVDVSYETALNGLTKGFEEVDILIGKQLAKFTKLKGDVNGIYFGLDATQLVFKPKADDIKSLEEYYTAIIETKKATDEFIATLPEKERLQARDSQIYKDLLETIKTLEPAMATYIGTMVATELEQNKVTKENYSSQEAWEAYKQSIVDNIDVQGDYSDMIKSFIDSTFPDYVSIATDLTGQIETQSGSIINLTSLYGTYAEQLKNVNSGIDSMQSTYETLSDAIQQYNEDGQFNLDTLQQLISLEPQYLMLLFNEQGQIELNSTAFQNLAQAKLQELEITMLRGQLDLLTGIQNETIGTEALTFSLQQEAGIAGELRLQIGLLAEQLVSSGKISQDVANQYLRSVDTMRSAISSTMSGVKTVDFEKIVSPKRQEEALNKASKKRQDSINKEIKGLQNLQKQADKVYQSQIDSIKKAAEVQINSLKKVQDQRKKIRDEEDYSAKRAELLAKLALTQQQTSREALEEESDLKKQLVELDKDESRRIEDLTIEEQIQSIENKRDAQISAIEAVKEAVKEQYEMQISGLKATLEGEKAKQSASIVSYNTQRVLDENSYKNAEIKNEKEKQLAADKAKFEEEKMKNTEIEKQKAQNETQKKAQQNNADSVKSIQTIATENAKAALESKKAWQDFYDYISYIFKTFTLQGLFKVGTDMFSGKQQNNFPKSHTGSIVRKDGLVNTQAGEIIVRKDLSDGLQKIISQNTINNYDNYNGRENIVENNYFAPLVSQQNNVASDVDGRILANSTANAILTKLNNQP